LLELVASASAKHRVVLEDEERARIVKAFPDEMSVTEEAGFLRV
jgi:hypothetical protein